MEIGLSPENTDEGQLLFTVDGRDTVPISADTRITVRKVSRGFHLPRLEGRSF